MTNGRKLPNLWGTEGSQTDKGTFDRQTQLEAILQTECSARGSWSNRKTESFGTILFAHILELTLRSQLRVVYRTKSMIEQLKVISRLRVTLVAEAVMIINTANTAFEHSINRPFWAAHVMLNSWHYRIHVRNYEGSKETSIKEEMWRSDRLTNHIDWASVVWDDTRSKPVRQAPALECWVFRQV